MQQDQYLSQTCSDGNRYRKAGHVPHGSYCYASVVTLFQGVPLETVGELLGPDWWATRIYAQVNNEKIDKDMRLLNKRLPGKFHLADNNVTDIAI
ncbi:MAG: hypothetical protein LBS20_17895 [Prevotella sp.]|nr:hypothetical protein [Prevotella sp.]